jgi:hypothetical protein
MMLEPAENDASQDDLSATWTNDTVEVTDRVLDQWVVRLEPITFAAPADPAPEAAVAVVRHLAMQFPAIAQACQRQGTDRVLQVAFSPAVQRMLATGQASLLRSGPSLMPVARATNGRFLEHAALVGGIGAAATAPPLWPVLLAAGVAAAASWSAQHWTEQAFARVQSSIDRIEYRLRDADHGELDAADALVQLLVAGQADGSTPNQLRMELAVARQSVETVYRARHRYVTRFKDSLEAAQTDEETRSGKRQPWAGEAQEAFAHTGTPVVEELLTYLQAMVSRARIGAWTAGVLAADGEGTMALRLLAQIEDSTRTDYWDLHNRLWALSRHEADSFWHKVPVLGDSRKDQADQARHLVTQLAKEMRTKIGPAIPERDEIPTVTIPAWQLAELVPA